VTTAPETKPQTDTVTLTIDGVEVTVPKGTLIIRAAEQVGVQVPRFCDHPLLDPVGACRQCIVDVEGQRKPLTLPATSTVTDGMACTLQLTSALSRNTSLTARSSSAAQPRARLPGLRQGRRVPAAEPDADQRQRGVALPRASAPRKPIRSARRCARPGRCGLWPVPSF
jgi:ferredoxin